MDFGGISFYLFAAASTLYILHFGFYLAGANLYDVWQLRRHFTRQLRAARGHTQPTEPLVTVLIPAHNEEKVIVRCLKSLLASTYASLQIIVVDDASKDDTAKLVRTFKREHNLTDMQLRLVRKRDNIGKGACLNYALRHHAQGEFAMTLDADSILAPDAIRNALSYFHNPRVVGVAAHVHILHEPTVLGVLQRFEHMIGYRSKKVYSLFNCEFVIGGVASTYRMSTLRDVDFYDTDTLTEDIGLSIKIINKGNRKNRIVYAADVVAATEGVESFRSLLRQRYRWKYGSLQNLIKYRRLIGNRSSRYTPMLTFYRMPVALISELLLLLAPFIWFYVLYMTFVQYNLGLIIGAYLTITVYVLITLWSAERLYLRDRLRLSAYAPIAYFVFYIMDLIQFIAICKCLARIHYLILRKEAQSRWSSPERIGKEVTVQ